MGGFHTECIFIAVIGKRFKYTGVKDLVLNPKFQDHYLFKVYSKERHTTHAMHTTRMQKLVYSAMW